MKVEAIGKLLIAAGVIVLLYAMNMDVTMDNSGIVNLHLISERQNTLIFGGFLFLAGIVLFAVFKLKQTKEDAETADQLRHERTKAVKSFLTGSDRGPLSMGVRLALGIVLGGYSAILLTKLILFVAAMVIGSFVPAYVKWMVPVVATVALIAYAFRKISIKILAIHFVCLALLATMSPPLHSALTVQPLSPNDRQRLMLAFAPKQMETPMFDVFLHETFKSSCEGEEQQQIDRMQEIYGATMFGLMQRYHKAVLFYDPYGRAGKGTACDILAALVPQEFVTNVSPFNWSNEYYLATLAGSRLNLVGELPENTPLPAAEFKTVTGGDILTGRHPAGRPFTFRSQAANICSSNHLPNTRDQSDAFFWRWLAVMFPNSRLRSGLPLDIGLAERMIASELPGIAHWAMQGGLLYS